MPKLKAVQSSVNSLNPEPRPHFTDPHHCPIVHADGPISVSQVQGTIVLSFSQVSPKMEARQVVGTIAGTDIELPVVARIGFPLAKINELIDVLQRVVTATTSAGMA
jgi:hypothetical protein